MTLGIMQPYFIPYIGYWQLINAVDTFVIYDDVQFIKGGWINRNNILLNDQKQQINLLLFGASANKLINQIEVQANQKKLIKTIELAYKKAPFFEKAFPLFLSIMEYPNKNLARFLGNSIIEISKYLSIDTEIVYSSEINKDNMLKAEEKVLNICKQMNVDRYINTIAGENLYSKANFQSQNIELLFIKASNQPYNQYGAEFVSNLSIMDILMFNDIHSVNKILKYYIFV